jgi:hypothetical protein
MLTIADLVSHLMVQIGAPLDDILEQKVRTSVLNAWGALFSLKEWKWMHRIGHLQLAAAQSTGSVEYDSSTKLLTLTGATWPTTAELMHVRLENSWYPVAERISDTVLRFAGTAHPTGDLPAETSYHIQQVMIPLDVEVGDVVQVVDPDGIVTLQQLSLAQTLELSEAFGLFTQPTTYALIHWPKYPNRWSLWVPHVITQDTHLKFLYVLRRPEKVVYQLSEGDVQLTGGVATFSEAVCRDHWVGCVLRISNNDKLPSGPYGVAAGAGFLYNDDAVEMRVTEYLTTTTVRVSDDATTIATDSPYVLSSHIDVKPGTGETLMHRLAEDQYGLRPVASHMEAITSKRRVREAFINASADDALTAACRDPIVPMWYSLRLDDLGITVS